MRCVTVAAAIKLACIILIQNSRAPGISRVEYKNNKYLRAKDAPGSWTTIDGGGLLPALILADVAVVPLVDDVSA